MVGGVLLDSPCMVFQIVWVCCVCDPSVRLDAPSICVVCVCWKVSLNLRV